MVKLRNIKEHQVKTFEYIIKGLKQVPTKVPIKIVAVERLNSRSHIEYGSPERTRTADLMINSHFLFGFNEYKTISIKPTNPLCIKE